MTDVQDITAYLSSKGIQTFRASGHEVTAHCFFCADGDPKGKGKLYLNTESWLYDCKRCGTQGNRATLLEHFGDEDELEHAAGADPMIRRKLLTEAALLAHEFLMRNDDVLLYLLERGLSLETIQAKKYGYIGKNLGLSEMLPLRQRKEASIADLINAGIINVRGSEVFNNAITIPYWSHGTVIQLRGKRMSEAKGPKYLTAGGDVVRLYNADRLNGADQVLVVEGEFDCFSGDTEVLTPSGWQRLDGYVGGPVTQVFPDGRQELVHPIAVGRQDDVERLRFFTERAGGIDLIVTPGHHLVRQLRGGSFEKHRADERPTSRHHMPRAGHLDGPGVPYSDDEISLLLAMCADASIDERKADGSQYVRFGFKKQRKVARLVGLLSRLGIEHSQTLLKSGSTSICFRVPNYLRAFKLMPSEWVTQASTAQRELILAEMVEWDGNRVVARNQTEFSSGFKWNAEWMQAIAHTSGRVATVTERVNKHGSWFKTSILHGKSSTSWQSIQQEDAGRGSVYAVQVPSGMLLVRRRGMVVVSGNCDMVEQALAASGDRQLEALAVVGLAGAQSWPEGLVETLSSHSRIYVGLDPDTVGEAAATKLLDELGARGRRVQLPEELPTCDWNDYLKDHDPEHNPHGGHDWRDVQALLREAEMAGKRLFTVSDARIKWRRRRDDQPGLQTGWASLDAIIRPGLKPGQLFIPLAKTGTGKALADSEPILTEGGWVPIGEARVGQRVYGRDGRLHTIMGVFPQGERDLHRVTFSDGAEVLCDEDHLWTYRTQGGEGQWRTATLREIRGYSRVYTPVAEPIWHPEVDLPVDPYTLGVLIGDGCFRHTSPTLATDDEIAQTLVLPDGLRAQRLSDSGPGVGEYRLSAVGQHGVNPLNHALRGLGLWGLLSHEKFIPELYLSASIDQRWALLQGLLDTDGSVDRRSGSLEFSTSSPRLAADFQALVSSLGGVAAVRRRSTTHRDSFRLHPRFAGNRCPLRLARKAVLWRPTRRPQRRIISIEPAGRGHATCISVDAPDQLFITRGHVVTHNTVWLSNLAYNLRKHRTLFVSLELTTEEVFEQLYRIHHFWNPRATPEELEEDLSRLAIIDQNRIRKGDLKEIVREYADEFGGPPEAMLVDYLQYYARGFPGSGQYEKSSDAVMELKAVSKEEQLVTIAPSQVSRSGEDGKPLSLDDARDSGVIEETGDFVAALYRPDQAVQKDETNSASIQTGSFNLQLLKSRHGGKGRVFNLRLSNLSLAIVDSLDRKAAMRVDQENGLYRQGIHYEDFRRDSNRQHAQMHLVEEQGALVGESVVA